MAEYNCPRCSKKFKRERSMLSHFAAKSDDAHSGSIRKSKATCTKCNAEFAMYDSRRVASGKKPNNFFCSDSCRSQFYGERFSEKVSVNCENCGEELERRPCEIEETNFSVCSDKCYSEIMSGKTSPNWEGGHPDYGEFWSSGVREETIKRDFECCRLCRISRDESEEKFGRDLEVHHKKAIRSYDDKKKGNKMSNLITLCKSCHATVEANGISL